MERAEKPGVIHCVQFKAGGNQFFQKHGVRDTLRAFLPGERGAVRVPVRHQLYHLAAREGTGVGEGFHQRDCERHPQRNRERGKRGVGRGG